MNELQAGGVGSWGVASARRPTGREGASPCDKLMIQDERGRWGIGLAFGNDVELDGGAAAGTVLAISEVESAAYGFDDLLAEGEANT